jgi:hypothetical protein
MGRDLGQTRVVNLVVGQSLRKARSWGGGHEIGRAFEICADRAWIRMRNGSDAGGAGALSLGVRSNLEVDG